MPLMYSSSVEGTVECFARHELMFEVAANCAAEKYTIDCAFELPTGDTLHAAV